MTLSGVLDSVFSPVSNPDFPFLDESWIGVAFERNAYDNTRMPDWFFRAASQQFGGAGAIGLMIAGDCFSTAGLPEVSVEPFDWENYRKFMLRPEVYSVEYKMASSDLQCACWADGDITIFGGEATRMRAVLAQLGGAEHMLEHMRQEFLLGEVVGYEDMDRFFRRLLFPDLRKPSQSES